MKVTLYQKMWRKFQWKQFFLPFERIFDARTGFLFQTISLKRVTYDYSTLSSWRKKPQYSAKMDFQVALFEGYMCVLLNLLLRFRTISRWKGPEAELFSNDIFARGPPSRLMNSRWKTCTVWIRLSLFSEILAIFQFSMLMVQLAFRSYSLSCCSDILRRCNQFCSLIISCLRTVISSCSWVMNSIVVVSSWVCGWLWYISRSQLIEL